MSSRPREEWINAAGGSNTDRLVLFFIALFQLGISSLLLFIQFIAYGGGFQPISTPFRLFGLVNSLFLFTTRPIPRLGAFLWQLIFVIWILVIFSTHEGAQSSPDGPFFGVVCLLMLISLIYLTASLRQELAKRGWNWAAWMRWE